MKRAISGVVAVATVALFGFTGSAYAASEVFWEGWTNDDQIGTRHQLTEASARNLEGGGSICITGKNDDGSMAGGTFNCTGGGVNDLATQPLNGSSWRRGWAIPPRVARPKFRARADW